MRALATRHLCGGAFGACRNFATRASRASPEATEACILALKAALDEQPGGLLSNNSVVSTNPNILDAHGRDESFHASVAPDAVVFCSSTEEVVSAVKICAEHGLPIVPFGAGTSLEGHVAALEGGVSLDLTGMNQMVEVNDEDLDCRVQAGVTRLQLNNELRHTGLTFPVDPGADATIGGMTATAASGTSAVRYGTMRDNVIGLTVVTADGSVLETGTRARKSSAGFDLTSLFVGSEGTLGIITEVSLRLHGQPEEVLGAICPFPSLKAATDTVCAAVQLGIPVARAELMDDVAISAVNGHFKTSYKEAPTLFFEFHGGASAIEEQAEAVRDLAYEMGAEEGAFEFSRDEDERKKLWHARHNAYYSCLTLKPGSKGLITDVCVPISRLSDCMEETAADIAELGVIAPFLSHAGDGNFHCIVLVTPDDDDDLKRRQAEFNERLVNRAIAMGGTCTGEHGVGHGKMGSLEKEHSPVCLDYMALIKRSLDPQNLFNPGKVVTWNRGLGMKLGGGPSR